MCIRDSSTAAIDIGCTTSEGWPERGSSSRDWQPCLNRWTILLQYSNWVQSSHTQQPNTDGLLSHYTLLLTKTLLVHVLKFCTFHYLRIQWTMTSQWHHHYKRCNHFISRYELMKDCVSPINNKQETFAIAKRTARRSCIVDLVQCQHCFLRHMG